MIRLTITAILLLLTSVATYAQPSEEELLNKIKSETNLDSLRNYYSDLGKLYFRQADFAKAQKAFFDGLRVVEKTNDKRGISVFCNNIAAVYNEMGKPSDGIPFSKRGIKGLEGSDDYLSLSNLHNTLAQAHYILYNYPEAIANFERSISLLLPTEDSVCVGTVYKNLGAAYFESGNPQMAVGYFKKGLEFRIREGDTAMIFTGYCGIAEMYNAMRKYDSAGIYLAQCRALLPAVGEALNAVREYYYAMYDMCAHTGKLQAALEYQEKYHQLKDSIASEDNLYLISEEKNKYALEKKEQEINHHKEIAAKEKRSRILVSGLLVVVLLLVVVIVLWYRVKQRERLTVMRLRQQEAERNMMIEGQESERRRIARELHDGIVQDLTAIALNMQSKDVVDKEMLIAKVTQAARDARNIAHQMMPVSLMQLGLINALEDLFQQTYAPLGIGYEFEHFTEADALAEAVSVSIYRICQELVANSVKHAQATLVHVLLRQTEKQIMLVFEDNGKGFDVGLVQTGIGMVSINSRVSYLNGEITFDTEEGTTAIIKIPLEPKA